MNEKRIQQVLGIEEQAQAIYDTAMYEAEQLQVQAEQDAQALIEETQKAAHKEVQSLVAEAQAEEECARILTQAEEEGHRVETLALSHIDRAVGYVLDRMVGKE